MQCFLIILLMDAVFVVIYSDSLLICAFSLCIFVNLAKVLVILLIFLGGEATFCFIDFLYSCHVLNYINFCSYLYTFLLLTLHLFCIIKISWCRNLYYWYETFPYFLEKNALYFMRILDIWKNWANTIENFLIFYI